MLKYNASSSRSSFFPPWVDGRFINRVASQRGPAFRAILAANLASGRSKLVCLTQQQASALCNVSLRYVCAAIRLTSDQCDQIERGEASLSKIHNTRKLTDVEVDQVIAVIGADRLMAALDRATAPALALAAEAAE